jgi:cytochrome c
MTARSALALAVWLAAPLCAAAAPSGDAVRGAKIYESHCSACHSLDANRIGPAHRGVFGRKAATVPGFAYTGALRTSGIVWSAAALDRWLSGPSTMVPGTAMGISLSSAQDRADVIAYLRQQK